MYELTLEECQRRRKILGEISNEMKENHGPDFSCACQDRAQAAQPGLIERLIAGENLAIEPILGFYQGCIDTWARDIYNDPVYESLFKAEIAARFIQACPNVDHTTLCSRLKIIANEIADGHLKQIEEHHLSNMTNGEACSTVTVGSASIVVNV